MAANFLDRVSINLSEEKEQELNWWINRQKSAIAKDREPFLERQKRYLLSFDDFLTFQRKGPWEDSANFHMPLTSVMVKSYHARLFNIFANEDVSYLSPREDVDEKKARLLRRLYNWYLYDYINEYRGIKGVIDELLYDVCTVGWGVLMKSWDLKQRKVIDLVKVEELEQEVEEIENDIQEGEKISVTPYKETLKVITAFEGTSLRTLGMENIWFPNDIPESSNLNHPPCVIVNTQMVGSDIWLKAKQGEFDRDAATKVLESKKKKSQETHEINYKDMKDRLTGYDSQNSYYDHDEYDIQYAFCSYDIDDDGINEEIVVTRSPDGHILKIAYLDHVNPSGKRPLFKFDCFSKPRQAYSRGVVETMYPLQEEMDLNHNMRMDYMQLQTVPFGVYRGQSSLDNQPIRIAPGKFIPVDDINDLRPITFNSSATVFSGEEDRLWRYAELLMSVSPLSQGQVPSNVGPTRSTSGVVAILGQMEKMLKPMVERMAVSFKSMQQSLLEDFDFRLNPETKQRVLGQYALEEMPEYSNAQIQEVGSNLIVSQIADIKINVADAVNSEEVNRNDAAVVMQMMVNPNIAHQMGIIPADAIHKSISDFLKSYNKDPEAYGIYKPQFTGKPLDLWQEIQICAQGEMPPMAMQDNHEEKAVGLEQFQLVPEYLEAGYSPEVNKMLNKAAAKHRELAKALVPQGLPNPQGINNQDQNQMMSGTAPQQGGQDPNQTTARPPEQ